MTETAPPLGRKRGRAGLLSDPGAAAWSATPLPQAGRYLPLRCADDRSCKTGP